MTDTARVRSAMATLLAIATLAACSHESNALLPISNAPASVAAAPSANGYRATPLLRASAASKLTFAPAKLALLGTGSAAAKKAVVSEKAYAGTFAIKSGCKGIATVAPLTGKGPSLALTITPVKAGTCSVVATDAKKNAATLPVSVTTASVALSPTSTTSKSASVTIVLKSVNGKPPSGKIAATIVDALKSCSKGCTVAAPQSPPGKDVYALAIFDGAGGKGKKLAAGSATATIVAGKPNTVLAALAKIPAYLVFGTMPAANAGTALTKPLPLTVQDADRVAIDGTYFAAVTVSDADASPITEGSSLQLGSAKAARTVRLASSSDAVKLVYGGLAIEPATLAASANGVTTAKASFAPAVPPIGYTGPEDGSTPEIDLYDPTPGDTGNSGTFTLKQTGWSEAPYKKNFAYTLGGTNNNCSSYAVTPASAGTAFTVTVAASPAPVAGTCTLTATGATSASTLHVTLTYTTGSVTVDGKRVKRPRVR